MTQVREPLNITDGGPPSIAYSIKSKTRRPVKTFMFIFIVIYIISIIATVFFTYNVTSWAQTETEIGYKEGNCNSTQIQITNTDFITETKQTEKPKTTELQENVKSKQNNQEDILDLRLPKTIIPNKYNIKLIPFIFEGNFTFRGEIVIEANVTDTSDNITLHAAELNIYSHNISVMNNRKVEEHLVVMACKYDSKREFYIIELNRNVTKDSFLTIKLKFIGQLNDNLHGFYRSSYDIKNTTRWIAATQFQATDARRAFPCFDEPALKATFKISIAHPRNMSALSNMNPESFNNTVGGLPDYMWTNFKESLPMSTYLVAFVVSDFANKSVGNYTVWARESAIESANYALDIGPKILAYFEDFYQIKYPLPKMDMIALPDFNAGAMENWGLLTFRETAMLYDGGVTARVNKPRIATVIAHELAHQWFGNLVTPSWWSDLWLNEGFASYVEYVGIDAVEKSWKSMDLFVIHEIQNVFALDALSSSHQIVIEVNNPNEINEIFDRISYGKGASIIRMMNHFLTSKVFNKGIANYLNNKKYQSATQMDLWESLTNQARKDGVFDANMSVATIMNTWTLQTGYPVVNVIRNYNQKTINFNQERFLLVSPQNKTENSTDSRWWIPITYTSKSNPNFVSTKPVTWMKQEKDVVISNVTIPENDWIIVNIQQTGFYRVNYDERSWKLIISHLNNPRIFEDIPPSNRAQILDDALNLALAGRLSYKLALDVTKYLVHEREFVPWKAGLVALGYIDGMLAKGPHYLEYKNYILSLIKGLFDEVGFYDNPDDSMLTMYKRIDVINIACLLEYDECVGQAVTLFHNYMMTPNPDVHNPISPNLRNVVYCTSVRVGGTEQWNFIWERFLNAQSSAERDVLITALGCTRHPWLLIRYLDHSLRNDSAVRKQDTYKVFGSVSNSVIGQPIAFSFLRQNWMRLKSYMGSAASNLNTIVKYSTRKMNSELELDGLKKFAKEYKHDLGRTIDQAIEKTEANIHWVKRNYNSIVQWLNENSSTR